MGESEKSIQIGDAIQLLQEQKAHLAHIEAKRETVAKAYRLFGSEIKRWNTDPTNAGKVFLTRPDAHERNLADSLLSQEQLAKLVEEHQIAADAVFQTRRKLEGFGITSL